LQEAKADDARSNLHICTEIIKAKLMVGSSGFVPLDNQT